MNKAPSDFMKLIAVSQDTVGTTAEDLATFVDITPYEYILVFVGLTGTVTATSLTLKFVHSTASAGSSPATVKDPAGSDLSATIATPANGTACSMWIRTRGLNKFGSPQISTGGAAADVVCAVYGVHARDSAELDAHWSGSFDSAGAAVTETAFS
jgi:hypothetical protein